jgi:hypothetical protein
MIGRGKLQGPLYELYQIREDTQAEPLNFHEVDWKLPHMKQEIATCAE